MAATHRRQTKTIFMTTIQFDLFYQNWLAKADNYGNDDLADQFDKFISLYVVFNSLYMEVVNALSAAGEKMPKDYKDKKAATDYVYNYLKSKFYLENLLNDQESVDSLTSICDIIENKRFNIILDLGEPRRDLDLELLSYLRSNSSQEKAKAILSLLYHIRCNMFHGQKGFEERQRELLTPVILLLRKTVLITYSKLSK